MMMPSRWFKNLSPFRKEGTVMVSLSVVGLGLFGLIMPLRPEHLFFVSLINLLFLISPKTRKFIVAFAIFLLFGLLYDLMKAYPNYLVNQVDIAPIYHVEKWLFGIPLGGQIVTPNEFFAQNHCLAADILSGLFYINWIPVPLAFALYLYLKNREQYLQFALTFLLVNLLGFSIYYLHPAAPPWYVAMAGFDFNLGIPGSTAGLARFDEWISFPLFETIYTRNSNVFAAMPSLHSAYPVVVFYYAVQNRMGWMNWLFAILMVGIWFAAVYSGHHYVIDVLAGILCATTGILIFRKVLWRNRLFQRFIHTYLKWIS